jgi:hypothetical protein
MSTTKIRDPDALTLAQLATAHGGFAPKLWDAMQHAVGMGLNVQWIESGPHYPNSRHWVGRAFDVGGSPAKLQQYFDWAKGTNPHELIYKNTFLKDGRRVHPIGGHDTHVHYSI